MNTSRFESIYPRIPVTPKLKKAPPRKRFVKLPILPSIAIASTTPVSLAPTMSTTPTKSKSQRISARLDRRFPKTSRRLEHIYQRRSRNYITRRVLRAALRPVGLFIRRRTHSAHRFGRVSYKFEVQKKRRQLRKGQFQVASMPRSRVLRNNLQFPVGVVRALHPGMGVLGPLAAEFNDRGGAVALNLLTQAYQHDSTVLLRSLVSALRRIPTIAPREVVVARLVENFDLARVLLVECRRWLGYSGGQYAVRIGDWAAQQPNPEIYSAVFRIARRAHSQLLAGVDVDAALLRAELHGVLRQELVTVLERVRLVGGRPTVDLYISAMQNGQPEHVLQIYNRVLAGERAQLSPDEVFASLDYYSRLASRYAARQQEVYGYVDAVPTPQGVHLPEAVAEVLEVFSAQLAQVGAEPVAAAAVEMASQVLPLGIMATCNTAAAVAALASKSAAEAIALKYTAVPSVRVPAPLPSPSAMSTPSPGSTPASSGSSVPFSYPSPPPSPGPAGSAILDYLSQHPWGAGFALAFVATAGVLTWWYRKPKGSDPTKPDPATPESSEDTTQEAADAASPNNSWGSIGKSDVAGGWNFTFPEPAHDWLGLIASVLPHTAAVACVLYYFFRITLFVSSIHPIFTERSTNRLIKAFRRRVRCRRQSRLRVPPPRSRVSVGKGSPARHQLNAENQIYKIAPHKDE